MLLAGAPADTELRTALVILITSRRLHRVQGHLPPPQQPAGARGRSRASRASLAVRRTNPGLARRARSSRAPGEAGVRGPSADDLPDIPAEFDRAANAFVRAELSPTAPLVSEFVAETPESFVRARPGARHRLALALYPEYLLAANGHRLWPANVSEPDRTRRRAFAVDLSGLLAESLGARESGRRNYQRTEGWQQDLLWALGPVTAMLPAHDARQLWEPLLALGADSRAGLDSYLRGLWRQFLSVDPIPGGAAAVIVKLIDALRRVAGPSRVERHRAGSRGYRRLSGRRLVRPPPDPARGCTPRMGRMARATCELADRRRGTRALRRPPRRRSRATDILSWLAEGASRPDGWAARDAALGEL